MNKGCLPGLPEGTPGPMPGLARAWVKFSSAATGCVILGSYNVASVKRRAAGRYTIYFQRPFATPHFVMPAPVARDTAGNTLVGYIDAADPGMPGEKWIFTNRTGGGDTDGLEVHAVFYGEC